MAWILATAPIRGYRDGKLAVEYAEESYNTDYKSYRLDTLAAAYAEVGMFEDAVKMEKLAIRKASEKYKDMLTKHLKFFEQNLVLSCKGDTCKGVKPEDIPNSQKGKSFATTHKIKIKNKQEQNISTKANETIEKSILGNAPNIQNFSELSIAVNKKDPNNGFKIQNINWSPQKTTVVVQAAGGKIRYDTHFIITDAGFFGIGGSGYTADHRMRIKSLDNNEEYYISEVKGYPVQYTHKNTDGTVISKTRSYANLPKKDYLKTNYSFLFKNIPSSALRGFNLHEGSCNDNGLYDICDIKVRHFNQEEKEQKYILYFLSKNKLNLISTTALAFILETLISKDQISDLQNFSSTYQKHTELVTKSITKIYNLVSQKNSIAGYQWFIDNYGDSKEAKEALATMHKLAFDEAKDIDTLEAYNDFIIAYPIANESLMKQARQRAYDIEKDKYSSLLSMFNKEKEARRLLIQSKKLEQQMKDIDSDYRAGYRMVVDRMNELLLTEFDSEDATLRYQESEELKDFIRTFKSTMRDIRSVLSRIEDNTRGLGQIMREQSRAIDYHFNKFAQSSEYRAKQEADHRQWERYLSKYE